MSSRFHVAFHQPVFSLIECQWASRKEKRFQLSPLGWGGGEERKKEVVRTLPVFSELERKKID